MDCNCQMPFFVLLQFLRIYVLISPLFHLWFFSLPVSCCLPCFCWSNSFLNSILLHWYHLLLCLKISYGQCEFNFPGHCKSSYPESQMRKSTLWMNEISNDVSCSSLRTNTSHLLNVSCIPSSKLMCHTWINLNSWDTQMFNVLIPIFKIINLKNVSGFIKSAWCTQLDCGTLHLWSLYVLLR